VPQRISILITQNIRRKKGRERRRKVEEEREKREKNGRGRSRHTARSLSRMVEVNLMVKVLGPLSAPVAESRGTVERFLAMMRLVRFTKRRVLFEE